MKPLAIVFSDLHLHVYNQFNEDGRRTDLGFRVIRELSEKCSQLIFCGDLFHENNHISNKLLDEFTLRARDILHSETYLYGISGNHDISGMSRTDEVTSSLFRSVSRFVPRILCLDYASTFLNKDICVFGVPYIDYNQGLSEVLNNMRKSKAYKHSSKRILMIHTDLHGAKDTDGREIGSVENMDRNLTKFFDGFDLVFSGHIHKPQRITPKIIMVGAPMQQRKSDMGGKFGYWELFEDLSYNFVPLDYPEFKLYDPETEEPDPFHYWIPINKESEYEEQYEGNRFTNNTSRLLLAKRYCKEKGIKEKSRINALKKALND